MCGLPVIITDQCHFPEVVKARAGKVIKPDAVQLAKTLRTLIDRPELCREMGENGRRLVKDKFTWDKVAQQMSEIYESVICGTR